MIWISSLLLGAALGALAAVAHAALFPLGLLIALFGTFAGLRLIMHRTQSRPAGALAAAGWAAVVLRAALPGTNGEILVWGQLAGTLFLAGGAISVILALLLEPKRAQITELVEDEK